MWPPVAYLPPLCPPPPLQINRQAPSLSFAAEASLNAPGRIAPSTAGLADRTAPASAFEAAVAAALSASGLGAVPGRGVAGARGGLTGDKAVLAAEAAELQQLRGKEGEGEGEGDGGLPTASQSPAAAAARTSQLASLRALMFYDEQVRDDGGGEGGSVPA